MPVRQLVALGKRCPQIAGLDDQLTVRLVALIHQLVVQPLERDALGFQVGDALRLVACVMLERQSLGVIVSEIVHSRNRRVAVVVADLGE
jgi:hypothetical protein